ncbi:glycosyltransferase [Futiania mangrovi]|uniref:Glycosyltransferase n=1 Tax=Futiania mangrovi TaxID=2959716 RepID=A0A9J6PD63_9PROT|nr:glycosyltransferase [Futiania mangrovii]MCP1336537.1 glycosyltransferase [Futiania mangrovii]
MPAPRLDGCGAVAVVLKGYPRLSETFIAQEILALQRLGLDQRIVSLRHPTDPAIHPVHEAIQAPVLYLPEYLHEEPLRVLRGVAAAGYLPGWRKALSVWRRDLARDRTRNRIRRFGQACVLAAELPGDVRHLHVHFLHTPASVARYAAMMRGMTWSYSAHAKDIWTTPDWEIAEKLADASWGTTCTAYGAERLRALAPGPDAVDLVYHGLDLTRFGVHPDRQPAAPPTIVCVGRAVAKKGLDTVLDALARLPEGLDWRFVHIGGGPLLKPLKAQVQRLGIAERCTWRGAQPQAQVLASLREATVFVLASRIAPDGDRDGLPNVLMEAQSQAVPVVATAVAAIPELVRDGETGLLVPPDDPEALSAALARLLGDPAFARRLGAAGEARVRTDFSMQGGIDRLARRFAETLPARAAAGH